jgi:O-antigen/teichoic acid export membrane protein/glycosyltransferase involved in cell wall biosynthesis
VPSELTRGRLLAVNTLWNLLARCVLVVVGVIAIPPLIRGIGVARFGVLTLAWMLLSYFGLFDLGAGRALTKMVADKLGAREEHDLPALIWTALLLMVLLGGLGTLVMVSLSPWLVERVLNIPEALRPETLQSFYLLAISLPIVTSMSGLRGVLEAQQRFGILNAIRTPLGAFTLAGPLLALPFSHRLFPVVAILVAGSAIGWLAHLLACLHSLPLMRHHFVLRRSAILPILHLGGWMTVSSVIAPLMIYLDRFLIGALLSLTAVAYYTAPFDAVVRLSFVPGAVVGVLFPAFALSFAQDRAHTTLLLNRGVKYSLLLLFPIVLTIVALAPEGLKLWLGPAFAVNSTPVLRWLAAGVLINCLAQIPFALVQGVGRPDITAKLHLLELPLYLLAVWWAVKGFGIVGASIAWMARATLDGILLFGAAYLILPASARFLRQLGSGVMAGLLGLYISTMPRGLATKVSCLCILLFGFASLVWFYLLSPEEKGTLRACGRLDRYFARMAIATSNARKRGGSIIMEAQSQVDAAGTTEPPLVLYVLTSSLSLGFLRGQLGFLHRLGFDVKVVSSPGERLYADAQEEGAQAIAIGIEREIAPFRDLVSLWQLWRVMRRLRPVITDVGTPKAGFLGGIAAWLTSVPCRIYTLHGLRCETTSGLKRQILLFTERVACLCAHRVLCVSESLRQKAVAMGIVNAGKARVLGSGSNNGIDAARFTPTAELLHAAAELRKRLGIPSDAPVVGFAGRLTQDKGIPELLGAYLQLRASFPKLRLLLLGDFEEGDPVPAEMRRRISEDPQIISPGFVQEIAPFYHLMDVIALPSHREGLACVLLEANAAGKPVVATRATGTVDAVVDGVTGILVPLGNAKALALALKRLLQDRELAETMGRAGRARVLREFRQDLVWAALTREYTLLLRQNGLHVPCTSSENTAPAPLSTAGVGL